MERNTAFFLVIIVCSLLPFVTVAQTRYYDFLRYNDRDFSYLKTDSTDRSFFNPIKYISLNASGTNYLTFGGEVRENYQWIKNENWGDIPPSWQDDNGFLWHRLMVHADAKFGKTVRLFTQLKNTSVLSRAGGPRPVTDKDDISLHQAFVDFNFKVKDNLLTLRAGRQEHNLGWGKLVSVREGPNNRQTFDGLTILLQRRNSSSKLFFANDVSVEPGAFDNGPIRDRYLVGLYNTHGFAKNTSLQLETYYFFSHMPDMFFAGETANDKRHTAGFHLGTTKTGFQYDLESIFQWGKFGRRSIAAYSFVGMLGYQWPKARWQPRVQIWGGVSTGDKTGSQSLNTYNPLYPRPPFAQAFAFGVSNLDVAQLDFSIYPKMPMRLAAGSFFLQRNSVDDGIYTPGVTPIRPLPWRGGLSELAEDVANYYYLEGEYFAGRHWQLNLQMAIVPAGDFIKQTGRGKTISYLMTQATFRF